MLTAKVRVTHPGNQNVTHHVLDATRYKGEIGAVASIDKGDHNAVRRAYSLIHQVIGTKNCSFHDFMLMESDGRWIIAVYTTNWPGRAAYYAGQITGWLKAKRQTANQHRKTSIAF